MDKKIKETLGKVGIIGGGGGLRGAVIPGFLEPLIRRKIPIHYLSAVSVSSLMFAKLAEAQSPEDFPFLLKHIIKGWEEVEEKGPKSVFDFSRKNIRLWKSHAIFKDNSPLWKLTEDIDCVKVVNSPIRFDVAVFDDETKEHKIFSNHDENLRQNPQLLRNIVIASASLRPLFRPTQVGDRFYYDGGYIDLGGALEFGCETIFVLFPYPRLYRKPFLSDNYINRYLPVINEFSALCSAILRDRDLRELEKIDRHNERVAWQNERFARGLANEEMKSKLIAAEEEILNLRQKIISLEGATGWLDKLSLKLSSWKDQFLSEQPKAGEAAKPEKMKIVRKIVLNAEPPETLVLSDFRPGDFRLARDWANKQMERELKKLLGEF